MLPVPGQGNVVAIFLENKWINCSVGHLGVAVFLFTSLTSRTPSLDAEDLIFSGPGFGYLKAHFICLSPAVIECKTVRQTEKKLFIRASRTQFMTPQWVFGYKVILVADFMSWHCFLSLEFVSLKLFPKVAKWQPDKFWRPLLNQWGAQKEIMQQITGAAAKLN